MSENYKSLFVIYPVDRKRRVDDVITGYLSIAASESAAD